MADTATTTGPVVASGTTSTVAPTQTAAAQPTQLTAAPQVTAPQTEPAKPEPLDPDYVARGGRWKLGEDDLRAVPRDVFERIHAAAESELIENLHRLRNGNGQQGQQLPVQQQFQQPLQRQASQQGTQQGQQPQGPFAMPELKFDKDVEADEVVGPFVPHLRTIADQATKNANELFNHFTPQIQQIVEVVKYLQEFADSTLLDHQIGGLGDEWQDVFGKGPTMLMDPKQPTRANRDAFKKAILENLDLDAQLGRERNPTEAMLRAQYKLYGQKIAQLERAKRETKAAEMAKSLPASTGAPNGRALAGGLRESVQQVAREMWAGRQ